MKENIEQLKKIVEQTHQCTAEFVETIPVLEIFQNKTVWEGLVYLFDIKGHPSANRCYAWSSPIEGTSKRRFFAVLHSPPINSPQDAVRAAIVQEFRTMNQK